MVVQVALMMPILTVYKEELWGCVLKADAAPWAVTLSLGRVVWWINAESVGGRVETAAIETGR